MKSKEQEQMEQWFMVAEPDTIEASSDKKSKQEVGHL